MEGQNNNLVGTEDLKGLGLGPSQANGSRHLRNWGFSDVIHQNSLYPFSSQIIRTFLEGIVLHLKTRQVFYVLQDVAFYFCRTNKAGFISGRWEFQKERVDHISRSCRASQVTQSDNLIIFSIRSTSAKM